MNTIYAATGDGFARLDRQGQYWTVRHQGIDGAQCLAVDPVQPAVLYLGTSGWGVWKSTDGGESWAQLNFPAVDVFSLAVSPADGALYAGTEPSRMFRSLDGGVGWQELEALQDIPSKPNWSFPPRPWTSHVRWIAPNPQDADLLLVGIELGGLMRSEDGGKTFEDHRPGAQRDVHCLAWHPTAPGRAYQAGGGGAAWSKDGGQTWQPADQGRDRNYTWALAVDPLDADTWFVSASPGAGQAHHSDHAQARIYRWRAGGPWQALSGGLPDLLESMPYALAFGGDELFAGLSDGRIWSSPDRGDTWHQLELDGSPLPRVQAMVSV
jgi:hypothetical protein